MNMPVLDIKGTTPIVQVFLELS